MITEDGSFRCEHCGELIPDIMLWIETLGTYKKDKYFPAKEGDSKAKAVYETFRWDFCDLHCLRDYLASDKVDWNTIHQAKHKTVRNKKK